MSNIVHTRIDYRLIHGQVITKWLKVTGADRILIIDDKLAKDEFLSMVYVMAAPTGVEVKILSIDESITNQEIFNKGKVLLLFKDIDTALTAIRRNLKIDLLQIGGLENTANRKIVHNQISMDLMDYEKLKEIEGMGISVYFQTIPGEEPANLKKIYDKLNK